MPDLNKITSVKPKYKRENTFRQHLTLKLKKNIDKTSSSIFYSNATAVRLLLEKYVQHMEICDINY